MKQLGLLGGSVTGLILLAASALIASACGSKGDEGSSFDTNGGSPGSGNSTSGGSSSSGGTTSSGGSGNSSSGGTSTGGNNNLPPGADACNGILLPPSEVPDPGAAGAGGAGSAGAPSSGNGSAGAPGGACTGVSYEAESLPVDMYVMLDRSVSMTKPARVDGKDVTRWEALRVAVEEFVENPEAVNVGMGLQFFNLSGGADKAVDCTASNYAEPLVPVANAPQSGPKIVDEMTKMAGALGGLTPTVPALQGAIQYAKELAPTRAGRKPVVVLVTDGLPTYCDDRSVAAVSAAAEAGYEGSPSIPTYVVGIEGDFNLDQIARKGGTRAAFNVRRNEDAGDKLVSALLNITESPIICEYEIPTIDSTNQEVDLDKVSLIYTPESTGKAEEFPRVQDASSCASAPNGGWYYDNPSDPKKILVCPCTCSRFGAGRVDVRLGCKPREWLG